MVVLAAREIFPGTWVSLELEGVFVRGYRELSPRALVMLHLPRETRAEVREA